MEPWENNNNDITLDQLFPDGDYSSILNNIFFSHNLELHDDNQNLVLPLLLSNNDDSSSSQITDENVLLELIRLAPDAQQDTIAIVDDGQPIQNSTVYENPDIINMPIPQQANGNQNGIMYQIYPPLFDFIYGIMFVKQQPKANDHTRYRCDGSRFLPDSRYHPMAINLPDLRSIILANNQTLGIVMTIVTSPNNPVKQTFIHANDIIYGEKDVEKIGYGCIFVPLKQLDIQNCEKKFPRLSIIYKKYDEYTFDLTPFDTATMFGKTEKYIYTKTNKKKVGNAAKGKTFKEDYNLLSYKIIFQLALKENNVVFISNITCETNIIDEKKLTKKSGKQSASSLSESLSEEESSSISNPPKKFKSSTPPPLIGLPVTRVSNRHMESDMDHQQ